MINVLIVIYAMQLVKMVHINSIRFSTPYVDGAQKLCAEIIEDSCVGCNLCSLVCPVPECIEMGNSQRRF